MDPEPPTRRIPPTAPPAAGPPRTVIEDERVLELADRVRSLRAWLAVATVLAVAALGLAAWALLTKEEEDDTRAGASRTSVDRLDSRVDELESQVENRASDSSVSELRADQDELAEQVQQLGESGDTDALEQSITDLGEDVQQLSERVDQLEQEQAEQPAP